MDYHGLLRRIRAAPFRSRLLVAALAAAAHGTTAHAGEPAPITVEPRIVDARLARLSLDQIDVDLRVALRASQGATIRSIAFTDAFVGRIPVWIEPVQGRWILRPGEELVLPQAVQVRVRARDAVGTDDFGAMVRRGSAPVTASVEVAIATPRLGRLFFMPPTRTLVRRVAIDLPVQPPPGYLRPLARIGADIADVAQRGAAAWLGSGLGRLPGRGDPETGIGGAVAGVTASYAVETGGTSTSRERRAAGIWWRPGVFCTTREVLEPWRFDVADATALQVAGGRLRREGARVRIDATRDHPAATIDLAALDGVLPAPDDRTVYTLVEGRPRRLRLADREAASNLACVRLTEVRAGADGPARPAATPAPGSDLAAFAPGATVGLVWTTAGAAADDRFRLGTPLHRISFGSPLVAGERVAGLVASPTAAWPAALVDAAAARAPVVASTAGTRDE